jgi:Dolichyl-phosphate-mannose-protein mannosyltransferase/Ca-dependent carbohydrate-binding module xylan-binding
MIMNKLIEFYKKNEALLIIVFGAIFLRLYHLCYQSIWVDELHTMIEADPEISFKESSDLILFREGIPRFHFFIVKIFNGIFGHNVFNARFVSVVFGVLSVIFIYKLGKKMFNNNVGLYSAIFLSLNLFLIEYSQEARTYSMLAFFVILSHYFLVCFLQKKSFKNALLLGISLGLITNSHPIGLLNVVSIFLVLLYVLLVTKESKVDLFKKIVISGIVCMILFIPTIPTIESVLKFKSFWISEPSIPYLFQVFNQLLGSSSFFTLLFVGIYFVFIFKSIQLISKKENQEKNKYLLGFIIINVWIWFEIIVILLKSYLGISIVLHRYFIAIVPAFMLIIAVTIDFIKNDLLKRIVIFSLAVYLIADIFLIKDFYSVNRKSQFDKVAQFIINKNTSKHKIVSSWGWIMSYYLNQKNGLLTEEKPLNNYIDDMRNGQTNPSSFWFVDGNSNVFQLSPENQSYVEQNFIIKNKLNVYDAWCIEFKSKHNENAFIELKNFQPSMFDGSGAMIFIENKSSKYPKIELEKGDYILSIKGFSLPDKPINGENAHFNIMVNNKAVKSLYLNNVPNQQPEQISIHHDGGDFNLELVYDNDLVVGSQDRNAVINSISLNKKK